MLYHTDNLTHNCMVMNFLVSGTSMGLVYSAHVGRSRTVSDGLGGGGSKEQNCADMMIELYIHKHSRTN